MNLDPDPYGVNACRDMLMNLANSCQVRAVEAKKKQELEKKEPTGIFYL